MKISLVRISKFVEPYYMVLVIFSIISVFFLVFEPSAIIIKTLTLFNDNTLIKLVGKQHFMVGGILGFVCYAIYYFSIKRDVKYNLKYALGSIVSLLFFLLWGSMLTEVLFVTAVPTNIIKWSNIFMGIDRAIFSVYPAFFMYEHYNFIFERIVVESYNYLTIFLSLWTLFLITTNRMEEFVRWSRDFLLALAISIPLWMVFPATQPSIMYVANIFRQPIPTELAKAIDVGPPSEYINMWSLKYSEMWIDQTGKRFSTSNFPSMHVIWGLLLLLSISRVFKSRIITSVFSLYALTNIIGTVYVLQHYAVDALVGILVVVLVISVNRDNN